MVIKMGMKWNPVKYAHRWALLIKDKRRRCHVLSSIVRFYGRTGEQDKALALYDELLKEIRKISSIEERNGIAFDHLFFLALDLKFVDKAKSILKSIERDIPKISSQSIWRTIQYESVVHGYARLGDFKKAIQMAMRDSDCSLDDILVELLKVGKERESLNLLEKIHRRPSQEEILLKKIYGIRLDLDTHAFTQGVLEIIEFYANVGKFKKAESMIRKLREKEDQIRGYCLIGHFENKRNNKTRAISHLNRAEKLLNSLGVDKDKWAVYGQSELRSTLSREYALAGKKVKALSLIKKCVPPGNTPSKKEGRYEHNMKIRRLVEIYELCNLEDFARRIAKKGDWQDYLDRKVYRVFEEKIHCGQWSQALRFFRKIKRPQIKVKVLDLAIEKFSQEYARKKH